MSWTCSTQQRGLQNPFHVHGLGTTLASTNNCIAQPAIERWFRTHPDWRGT
jgi:hypothetical protein